MEDIRKIVSNNISRLRLGKGLTQLELAESLQYTDRAISKWEKGESLPDICVLVEICKLFGVSLDYLVTEHEENDFPWEHSDDEEKRVEAARLAEENARKNASKLRTHVIVTGMSVCLVWLITLFVFMVFSPTSFDNNWITFIYGAVATSIVSLVLSCVWFPKIVRFILITMLMWTSLTAIYLSLLVFAGLNWWLIFLLGVPGQLIILFWSRIKVNKKQ